MTLAAGELRHRLRLQVATTTKDAMGTPVQAWVDVAPLWAKRTNLLKDTAEAVLSGAEVARQTVRFDMRPRAIDPTMRLVDAAGVVFDIRSIGLSNDRSELAVIATSNGEIAP